MTVALCVPLGASILLWGAAPRIARRLPPATAVRLLTATMIITSMATGLVLAVAGALAVAQIPVVATLGRWSVRVLATGSPVPVAAGALATVTVSGLLLAALRRAALSGRDLVLAALACQRLGHSTAGLVIVDRQEPDAYAIPGLGGRVVVSTAMLRALPAAERRVLLAHETAHLTHRHHLWVHAADLAAAADPLLRPGARAVRVAVERWADEVAAAEVGDRSLTARALARAGLARAGARRTVTGDAPLRPGAEGAVADRARALLRPAPQARRALTGAVLVLMLATLTAALSASVTAEARFEAAESAYVALP